MQQQQIRKRGSSLLESVFTLLVFTGMLIGIFDVGQVLFLEHVLADRVRAAVRYGSVNPDDTTGIRNLVLYGVIAPAEGATPGADLTADMVAVNRTTVGTSMEQIAVAVSGYRLQFATPLFPAAITGRTIAAALPIEDP
jgi:hypothetical protein